ncbi:tyrosine-type recombinase/integrase [Qipengyuania psychrotolerans]|uniref:Integrase arm-type DNA-binding domain-containing protein n=1 Tax=Qipengyuania psychrotolerans TaxID=2867238 RepID=A0ABX8ZHJ2_9SPHN|nr:integrase arm-type DNA-binding domain-containing protein [Qipengyuania psychrotolerans]QZD86733.1 integrase arm-type DNA-binding domain-containing protein [Qipengyuania psychrotolerans]
MPLTELAIESAKPGPARRKLTDGGGLHLEVGTAGTKTFKLSYRFAGKQKTITGGRYPDMKLVEARAWREEMKRLIREGTDPALLKRRLRQQRQQEAGQTFEAVAREWHEKQKARWAPKHAAWILARFENDPFPLFGQLPIKEVRHADIMDLIARYEKRGALEIGRKALSHVSAVMRYAIATGRAELNPVPDTRGAMRAKPPVQHRARLPKAELPEFFSKLEDSGHDRVTKLALRWTILTLVRTGETRFFRPEEIERRSATEILWRIPASRMKMGRDHVVPLPTQAVALLDEIEFYARKTGSPWQFPQKYRWRKPISENCMLLCLYDLGYKGRATVHGFRGLASTILNEQVDANGARKFASDWIEMQLAHAETNAIRGAYNSAEYLAPRREMMQWWADFLEDQEEFGKLL